MIVDKKIKRVMFDNVEIKRIMSVGEVLWEKKFVLPNNLKTISNPITWKRNDEFYLRMTKIDVIRYSNKFIVHHNIDETLDSHSFIERISIGVYGQVNLKGRLVYDTVGIHKSRNDETHKIIFDSIKNVVLLNDNYFSIDLNAPELKKILNFVITFYLKPSEYLKNKLQLQQQLIKQLNVIYYY